MSSLSVSASSSARPTVTALGREPRAASPRGADLKRRLRTCAALRTEGEHVARLRDAFGEVWEDFVLEERREVLLA